MTDIEKARLLFRDEGLAFPAIPAQLAGQLKERGRWVFSTRPIDMSPYNLQHYVHEVDRTQVEDYAVLSHSGHGVNSYAIQYYLVQGHLRMFLHLGWGGAYMDKKEDAATIRDCFSIADQVVRAAQSVEGFHAGEHLTVVGSDFYGSYWLRPAETRPGKDPDRQGSRDVKPQEVLTGALGWLTSCGGAKPPGKRIAMPIPNIQSLLLPVLRIVAGGSGHSVEEIRDRLKDEFELTDEQLEQTHQKSGINIFVNRVAWALAHLVMGKAVTPERVGFYKMTERGVAILKKNPLELTIKELH